MNKTALIKKTISLLIALLVVAIFTASCADTTNEANDVSDNSSDNSSVVSMEEYLKGEDDIIRYIYDNTKICIAYSTAPARLGDRKPVFVMEKEKEEGRKAYPTPCEGDTITVYGEKYTVDYCIGYSYHLDPYEVIFKLVGTNEEGERLAIQYVDPSIPPLMVAYSNEETVENTEDVDVDKARQVALEFLEEQFIGKYNMDFDIEEYTCIEVDGGDHATFMWDLYSEGFVKTRISSFQVRVKSDYKIEFYGYTPFQNYERFDEITQIPPEKYQELYTKMLGEIYVDAVKIEWDSESGRQFAVLSVDYIEELNREAIVIDGGYFDITYPNGDIYSVSVDFYITVHKESD